MRCARHTDHVFVYDPQNGVNQKDVDALFDRMRNVQAPDDETIMERVPQNYMVDDNQEVRNPVGSFGKKLSSTFNFILCLKTPMQRLDMALKRLGIKMLGVMSDALATPEASSRIVRLPRFAALTASESAIIVFPTPPQPEHTAYIFAIVVLRYQYASELEGGMVSSPSSPMCSK